MNIREYRTEDLEVKRLVYYSGNAYDPCGMYALLRHEGINYHTFIKHCSEPPVGGKTITLDKLRDKP